MPSRPGRGWVDPKLRSAVENFVRACPPQVAGEVQRPQPNTFQPILFQKRACKLEGASSCACVGDASSAWQEFELSERAANTLRQEPPEVQEAVLRGKGGDHNPGSLHEIATRSRSHCDGSSPHSSLLSGLALRKLVLSCRWSRVREPYSLAGMGCALSRCGKSWNGACRACLKSWEPLD